MDHDHERIEEGDHTSRPQEDDDNKFLEVLADEEVGAAWGSQFSYAANIVVFPREVLYLGISTARPWRRLRK